MRGMLEMHNKEDKTNIKIIEVEDPLISNKSLNILSLTNLK